MMLRCGSKVLEPYLLGTNRPGTASLSVAAGALSNVALLYLLLPRLGLLGAAIGVVGSYLVSFAILMFFFLRHSGFRAAYIFRLKRSDFDFINDSLRSALKPILQKAGNG